MRIDGRAAEVLRPVRIERGYTKHAHGSVLIAFGDTKVLCTAMIEDHVPRWRRESGKGWVTAEYAMLPGSSTERIDRSAARGGRAQEISRLIGRSLRAVTDLEAMGQCQVTLDCDVLQADGSTRCAAITGAYVALHDAFTGAVKAGHLAALPLRAPCAAVSAGVVDGEVLLDLCYAEDSRAEVDMNVVLDGAGNFIEIQGSAEGASFSRAQSDAMLDAAAAGAAQLFTLQKEALGIA